ncbi:MAG: ABC transporter ATP-binding protein, partial [Clostridia bacterium]|nr:ABC transporter ATP-binding protein [Clostridia bacterium]
MPGGGPGGFMPPSHRIAEKNKEPKPENIRQVPGYLKRVIVKFFSRLFYIFGLVWETSPWILVLLVVLSAAEGLLPIAGTYISAQIINALSRTLTGEELLISSLGLLFVFQFAYLFLNRLTTDVNRILSNLSGELVTNHIRRKIMHKVKDIDVEAFDRPDFYEGLENANREAGMRPIQILNATLNIISVTVSLVGFIVILVGISGWAPLLVAFLALPSAIVSFVYRKKTAGYLRIRSKARRQMNYYSSTVVNKDMIKEVRLLGLNDEFERRYDTVFRDYFRGLRRLILQEGAWNVGLGILRIFVNCFLFFFVATLVLEKQIRIGDYSFYTGALSSISSGVTTFVNSTASIYEGTLFIDNLILFMKQKATVCSPENPEPVRTGVGHTIEFDHVSFRYPGSDHDVIHDFSLKLEAGQTVALVGFNGAGKTT